MAAKTVKELAAIQQEVRARVADVVKTALSGSAAEAKTADDAISRLIEQQEARLAQTREAREAAVARFDADIASRQSRIGELRQLKAQLERGLAPGGQPDTPGGGPHLRDVPGIDGRAENLLRARGIRDVEMLRRTPANELARVLEVPEAEATNLLGAAERISRR